MGGRERSTEAAENRGRKGKKVGPREKGKRLPSEPPQRRKKEDLFKGPDLLEEKRYLSQTEES